MRIRTIVLAGALVLTLAGVPLNSHAASANVYSIKGAFKTAKSSWSLDAKMVRMANVGPVFPKGAHVVGSGILTVAPVANQSGVRVAVATGIYTIRWSDNTTSRGNIVCGVSPSMYIECYLRINKGRGKGGHGDAVAQRNGDSINGLVGAFTPSM